MAVPSAWWRTWGFCLLELTHAACWGCLGRAPSADARWLRNCQALPKEQAPVLCVGWELVTKLCTDFPICLERCFSNVLKQQDPLFLPLLIKMLSQTLKYNRGKMEKVEAKSPQCPLTLLPQALRLRTPARVSTGPPRRLCPAVLLFWVEPGCRRGARL